MLISCGHLKIYYGRLGSDSIFDTLESNLIRRVNHDNRDFGTVIVIADNTKIYSSWRADYAKPINTPFRANKKRIITREIINER